MDCYDAKWCPDGECDVCDLWIARSRANLGPAALRSYWNGHDEAMNRIAKLCRDRAEALDPSQVPVPAESATMPKCANPSHPFCDEAGAGGCYPCRACGGKTEIGYPTADGLKWRPCPECSATKGET